MTKQQDNETTRKKLHESKEMKRLKRLIKFMSYNDQQIATAIYPKLVFIDNTLNNLEQHVENEGTITNFIQGEQEMKRENPALTSHVKVIQRYNQLLKQFIELLPVQEEKQERDELMDFIQGGAS